MITSQQLNRYYTQFADIEVTFTRQVAQTLRILPKFVFLKCQADTLPCIIYSTSLREAKVIANLRVQSLRLLQQADGAVALRFCFARADQGEKLAFFVGAKITGLTAYNKNDPELYFVSLEYTQRPPDDLIEMLGELLEANVNAQKRAEVRIDLSPASQKSLGLESREVPITVGGNESRCIVRDLSFSGAKVLVYGQGASFTDQSVVLHLPFADSPHPLRLAGKVVRWEAVANRDDIGAIGILFDQAQVPMPYKLAINSCLRQRPNLPDRK